MAVKTSFNNINTEFSIMLRTKVDEYFTQNKKKYTGNFKLYLKTIFLGGCAIASYSLLILQVFPIWVSIILCVLLGISLAAIGFNVMHEGGHGSYSSKRWINDCMAFSLNIMGGNSFLWKQKHNVTHHSFTNIEGLDDDIDIKPWFRTNENQPKRPLHRYQHIYWVLLYGSTYFMWVYSYDFKRYFTGKVSENMVMKKMKPKEHIVFWVSKIVYFFFFIVLPIIMVGVLKTLIGYLITSFVCGWVISIVFQLAHLVEDTEFPMPDEQTQKLEHDWTIHQLVTTANFSTKSKLVTWLTGGLNYQIEHHLFPKISHIHYPSISEIVKTVCLQNNIIYREYPTVLSALKSHIVYLKLVSAK